MRYSDINKRYTEIVAEYIAKGYTINTATMSGSQGETAKIDLTNGTEVIRIMIDSFRRWDRESRVTWEGHEIIVGKATDEVEPNSESAWETIWNGKLEIISKETFYKIGENRNDEVFYGTKEEAGAAAAVRIKRDRIRFAADAKEFEANAKVMEIAERVVRNKMGVKRVTKSDVIITKNNGGAYTVYYRGKAYKLH